jgi:hypothetical protein
MGKIVTEEATCDEIRVLKQRYSQHYYYYYYYYYYY